MFVNNQFGAQFKQLNQKLVTENAIITQADKDHCSQQTKAGFQLNQPKKSIKKTTIRDEKIEPEISNRKYNIHASS